MKLFEFGISQSKHDEIKREWPDLIRKASSYGITIDENGVISGRAKGLVILSAEKVTVRVDDKPFYVPWTTIESGLRDLFS